MVLPERNQRLKNFERKLFRSTSTHNEVRTKRNRIVYDRALQPDFLDEFIDTPDRFISEGKLLKDGDSTTVVEITVNERPMVLKRYNIIGFWQGLRRLLQVSRAHHSWRNASALVMLGVSTPRPYLFMEERYFWFFKHRAYYLSEKIESDHLLIQLEENPRIADNCLIEKFEQFFEVLWNHKISHGDMKASNFIFLQNKLFVLDLDAMKRYRTRLLFLPKFRKDLNRFERNWLDTKFEPVFSTMLNDIRLLRQS